MRKAAGTTGTIGLIVACLASLLGAGFITPDNEPLPVPGYENGFLPGYLLTQLSDDCWAENHVAPDLKRLLADAKAAGVALSADDCYRDYAGQVYWRNYYCSIGQCQLAAVPGTSMHGWGKAVDFGTGSDDDLGFNSPGYRWLKANAARYNFNHPDWAEPGTDSSEPWHWEWLGDGGTKFGHVYTAVASRGEAARNQDGRLEVFGVGSDHTVRHLWQQAGSPSGWSPVSGLGGSMAIGSLQVLANQDGRLELFGVDTANRFVHSWQVAPNAGWSGWGVLGDRSGTPPAVGRNDDGRLEVFTVDASGALWHTWQVAPNSSWAPPAVLGTGFTGSPGLAATDDGRLAVFAVGTDGVLRGTAQTAPNQGFSTMVAAGSSLKGRPAVAVNGDGHIEVFALGTDNRLWHSWQQTFGSTANAKPLDMTAAEPLSNQAMSQSPTVSRNPDGRLEIFAVEGSGHLGHQWQVRPNAGWSGWESLGTTAFTGTPTVAMNFDGRLEVFAGTPGGQVLNNWQVGPNAGWNGFVPLASGLGL
jgi:D-alanyl-D-alanine carboxypeptidase